MADITLPKLLQRTLSGLEEQVAPDDPALHELKSHIVRSVAELEVKHAEELPKAS